MKYPLTVHDVIDQADIDAGRVNLVYNYKTIVNMVNDAFYSGAMLILCESKEQFQALSVNEKIALVCIVKTIADEYYERNGVVETVADEAGTGVTA